MPRLLFEKKGNAVWMSHLDLMRLFQRAFKRAGLPLKHTQGFNPRPSVSIALPLSVGVESSCEILDFELDGVVVPCDDIVRRLNEVLVTGVRVIASYDDGMKIKSLAYLQCTVILEYDDGIPEDGIRALEALFARSQLMVEKRGKKGIQQQDIISMIRSLTVERVDGNTVQIRALVCCQNPSLNPALLAAAVEAYLPEWKPDFWKCSREEIFTLDGKVFR